ARRTTRTSSSAIRCGCGWRSTTSTTAPSSSTACSASSPTTPGRADRAGPLGRLERIEHEVQRRRTLPVVVGGEVDDQALAHSEHGVVVEVVALAVEAVGDQPLVPGVLDPRVEVTGPHPAPVVGLQQVADRAVVGDRVLARPHGADLVVPFVVAAVDPAEVVQALAVELLDLVV